MELFTQLFGDLLVFVYHCFDRIVIYGYLSGLSRPLAHHRVVRMPGKACIILFPAVGSWQNRRIRADAMA